MRFEFSVEGGIAVFPGLSKPVAVDSACLSEEEAQRLAQLVEQSHFFDLPEQTGCWPQGAADYQFYVLTVDDGRRRHTVRVLTSVPAPEPALDELVQAVRSQAKAIRAMKQKGPG